ncbi:hypothetical protein V8B55DRAFT_1587528 [Mucor lusitanicus]
MSTKLDYENVQKRKFKRSDLLKPSNVQQNLICTRLEGASINPSLFTNGRPVSYTAFQVQPRIIGSTRLLCRCRPSNEQDATDATAATDATRTSVSDNDDDDELQVDVHKLKLKFTSALKRKQRCLLKTLDGLSEN